MFKRFTYSIFS